MARHENSDPRAPVSNQDGATFKRILSGAWNGDCPPATPGPGFHEDAAAFKREASGEAPPLAETERQALALWRRRRAVLARCEALDRQLAQARAAMPEQLRDGPKYLGHPLSEDDAQQTRGWPAITGVEVPSYGRIDVRPGPDDLLENWRRGLAFTDRFATDTSGTTRQARNARAFDKLIADFAALGERVRAQREAERAVCFREIEAEVEQAANDRLDLVDAIHALRCGRDTPHALACIALLRLDDGPDDETGRAPNPTFFRAILARLLPRLTGEIAEDVAAALARDDDSATTEE